MESWAFTYLSHRELKDEDLKGLISKLGCSRIVPLKIDGINAWDYFVYADREKKSFTEADITLLSDMGFTIYLMNQDYNGVRAIVNKVFSYPD